MAAPSSPVTTQTYVVPENPFIPCKDRAWKAGAFTVIITVLSPIHGAAFGTYCATDIVSKMAMDEAGINDFGLVGRIAKTMIAYFLASAAGAFVATGFGLNITDAVFVSYSIAICARRILRLFEEETKARPDLYI
jgi:hypothetical protein